MRRGQITKSIERENSAEHASEMKRANEMAFLGSIFSKLKVQISCEQLNSNVKTH